MQKINKIFILFIILMGLSIFSFWQILHSNWVAARASKVITKYVETRYQAKIEFDSIGLALFPPGLALNKIKFETKSNGQDIHVGADEVGAYFNMFDVFRTEISIDRIKIEKGYAIVSSNGKDHKAVKKDKYTKVDLLEKHIFSTISNLPIVNIELSDIYCEIYENTALFETIELKNKKTSIGLKGRLKEVKFPNISKAIRKLDAVEIDGELKTSSIEINKLSLFDGLLRADASGKIQNYLSPKAVVKTEVEIDGPLRKIHEFLDFKSVGELYKGEFSSKIVFTGTVDKYAVKADLKLKNAVTSFFDAKNAALKVKVNPKEIIFSQMSISNKNRSIKLKNAFQFYDFDKKLFVEDPVVLEARKVRFGNILKYLSPSTDMIKGDLSGIIRFDLGANDFHFTAVDKVRVDNFILDAGDNFHVFEMNSIRLEKARFDIFGSQFQMDVLANNENNSFPITAKVDSNIFSLDVKDGRVKLETLNPILGQELYGFGSFNLNLKQEKKSDLVLNLNSNLREFGYLGYKLEKLNSDLNINLTTNSMKIKRALGRSGKSIINAIGRVDTKTKIADIGYDVRNLSYTELTKIAPPLFKDFFVRPESVSGKWTTRGKVTGVINPKDVVITGKLFGGNTYIYNESIDRFTSKYSLKDNVFKISDVEMSKTKGKIFADFEYEIEKKEINYGVSLIDIEISDLEIYNNIPLSLESLISGDLEGRILKDKHDFFSEIRLDKSHVGINNFKQSRVKIDYKNEGLKVKGTVFGNMAQGEAFINLGTKLSSKSKLDLNLDIKDLNKVVSVFSGVGVTNDLEGKLVYRLKSTFDLNSKIIHDIESNVKEMKIEKAPVSLNYIQFKPEIRVKDTKVKKWSMNIRGKKIYILSKADGSLGERLRVTNHFKVDSSILEIFGKYISKASGNLRSKVELFSTPDSFNYYVEASSNNLAISSPFVPVPITNGKMFITAKDNKININKLKGQLISGSADLEGQIDLSEIIPEVDFRFSVKNATIPIMQKSNLNFSGDGSFVGKGFPYTLGGDFQIQKFVLINEISDFASGGNSFLTNDINYLPESSATKKKQFFNFNLNVSTQEPLFVKNSLADIGFIGNLHLTGGEKDLKLLGNLSLAPRDNVITFKNNEFNVNKGDIHFYEQNSLYNPELDFLVNSTISDHKVTVKVIGPLKKFDVDFLSEPSLPRNDILSLIAFGYTEDLSTNLTEAEKESMTRAGVGSIIFDSFKINETLKKEFGLQVNLGTEISQKSGSYLSGRNSDGGTTSNKVQSSTKFEVKKEISEDMSVSVSSTFGQSSGQKQGLNLNYNVNTNVSLEGIYEAHTSQDAETINSDTSIGADIKLKWSFK